jgi:hypothetical protein
VTVHAGTHEEYRHGWVVAFVPPGDAEGHAALVATEQAPNDWRGTWTYRPERVEQYVREEF